MCCFLLVIIYFYYVPPPQFLLNESSGWDSRQHRKLASRELTSFRKCQRLSGLEGSVCLDTVFSSMKGRLCGQVWRSLLAELFTRLAGFGALLHCHINRELRRDRVSKPVPTGQWLTLTGPTLSSGKSSTDSVFAPGSNDP